MFLRNLRNERSWRRCFSSKAIFESAIAELNKEMEEIFGVPRPSENIDSPSLSYKSSESEPKLTHVDKGGQATMVNISSKQDTQRVAVASCKVLLDKNAFNLVAANHISKGDVLNVAKIAGICGAKQTSNLIPLCHNICLSHIRVDLNLNDEDSSVEIEGEAVTLGKTGVEMEAMAAVTIARLTVYDMCKAVSTGFKLLMFGLIIKVEGRAGFGIGRLDCLSWSFDIVQGSYNISL